MRTLRKVALFLAGMLVLILVTVFCWLYFYSREDLPDMSALQQYVPLSATRVSDPCHESSVAIPWEALGPNLRGAISASETNQNDPGVVRTIIRGFAGQENQGRRTAASSWYLSRTMCYPHWKNLKRELAEIRTAISWSDIIRVGSYSRCSPTTPLSALLGSEFSRLPSSTSIKIPANSAFLRRLF
jgi:hypothetical protein